MSVLTRATWRNIPEDGILHSHHSENLKSCNNYHGMSLLSISCKILLNILFSRLSPHIDDFIWIICVGVSPHMDDFIGIIRVGFDHTDQMLIGYFVYFAFIRYW
jgi:hypothetical protein